MRKNSSYSISMWVKPETLPSITRLISMDSYPGGGYTPYTSTGKVRMRQWNSSDKGHGWITDNTVLSTGTWTHIVITSDISTEVMVIYIDGVAVAVTKDLDEAGSGSDVGVSTNDFTLGAHWGTTQNFDGLIDELTITSDIITSGEVTTIYNSGAGIPYEEPITPQALAVTAQATAGVDKGHFNIIATTAQATASVLKSVSKAIATTASATAGLVKTQVTPVIMAVTAQATAGISKIQLAVVSLAVTAQATITLGRVSNFVRTLAVTAQATPALIKSGIIIFRALVANAQATVTMGKSLVLSKALQATAQAITSVLTDWGYIDKYPENDTTYSDKYPES